jgi:hypothetical protein
MFHETLPPPYAEAWDRLRRESHHYAGQFAREGVPVRLQRMISPPSAEPDTINWTNIESVTYQEWYVRLQVPDILDRVCGMVPREELHVLESFYRGYNFRHQRQLCPEYEQAVRVMMDSNLLPEFHSYMYQGVPVRDSQYFGSEPRREDNGIIRVGPLEVFKAMHVCGVSIPEPLFPFYGECRRVEDMAMAPWPTGASAAPVWHGQYPWREYPNRQQQAYDLQRAQANINNLNNAQADVARYRLNEYVATGTWEPRLQNWYQHYQPWNTRPLTAEQQAARDKRNQEYKETRERALALLERVVAPEEFKSFNDNKYIELTGKKYRYRIKQAGQTALYNLKSGVVEQNACLQLKDSSAPTEDRVVMEYLMIKNKENKYLKTANLFPTGPPSPYGSALERAAWSLGLGGAMGGIFGS